MRETAKVFGIRLSAFSTILKTALRLGH